MYKYIYYLVVLLMVGVLLWFIESRLLATPQPTAATPLNEQSSTTTTTTTEVEAALPPTSTTTTDASEIVRIEGVFLSLQEMEVEWRTGHTYLLLDDGTEIFRIDLRPLLGNTTREVAEKLGIIRGDRVAVEGTVNDKGEFRVQSISQVSPTNTEQTNQE